MSDGAILFAASFVIGHWVLGTCTERLVASVVEGSRWRGHCPSLREAAPTTTPRNREVEVQPLVELCSLW
jgi:hypothetical protein